MLFQSSDKLSVQVQMSSEDVPGEATGKDAIVCLVGIVQRDLSLLCIGSSLFPISGKWHPYFFSLDLKQYDRMVMALSRLSAMTAPGEKCPFAYPNRRDQPTDQ